MAYHAQYQKEYRDKNKKRMAAQQKKWREANPDRVVAYRKKYAAMKKAGEPLQNKSLEPISFVGVFTAGTALLLFVYAPTL